MKHNNLMSENYNKACNYLNYVEHLIFLASIVTGWALVFAFASLVSVPVGIASSAVESSEVLISKALIDSYISHNKFMLYKNNGQLLCQL